MPAAPSTSPSSDAPAAPATSPAPAPVAPPPPSYPTPSAGYGAPPPQYYWPPPPQYAPPPEDTTAQTTAAVNNPKRGPYFGAWLGVGAPFGGDTTLGKGAGYKEGFGVVGTAGYAFVPNFGVDAFIHYNQSSVALRPQDQDQFSENSGYVVLYGLEARGIVGSGSMFGWASIGLSLGTGSLTLTETFNNGLGTSAPSQSDGEAKFKVMPVLAFGAEIEVTKGLGIGPTARWYIVNVESACDNASNVTTGFDPNTGQPITGTRTTCAAGLSDVTVPDILFLGFGLTYRIGI
jgi:hypothetical protein